MATTDETGRCSNGGRERGAALVAVLLVSALLAAIGLSVALIADVEVTLASNHRDGLVVRHAAEGAADFAVQELATMADWAGVLNGGVASAMSGPLVMPAVSGGTVVDASAVTLALQQEAYGGGAWGADTPRWRLFGQGVPGVDLPLAGLPTEVYALVWVSDDIAESDGDPLADANGVVVVRVRVMGPRRSRSDVQLVVARTAPGIVRRVSSRVMR